MESLGLVMGQSIAVMNTKGGVGKSTVVMGLAETLSVYHQKNVLIVDSDSQTSITIMMMSMERWEQIERDRNTLLDYLSNMVLGPADADWKPHVAANVSDVDDAKSVYIIPSHMKLSLFEREVSAERRHAKLRVAIRDFLAEARHYFDIILVDCPPGLSVVTECWLREADFFLPPTKPDYLSVRGLEILKRFKEFSSKHGFAELAGVLINMKDGWIDTEDQWHTKLAADASNRCFSTPIYRRPYIQKAADYDERMRTFAAKYPGDAGESFRRLADELLSRLAKAAAVQRFAATAEAPAGPAEREPRATAVEPREPEPVHATVAPIMVNSEEQAAPPEPSERVIKEYVVEGRPGPLYPGEPTDLGPPVLPDRPEFMEVAPSEPDQIGGGSLSGAIVDAAIGLDEPFTEDVGAADDDRRQREADSEPAMASPDEPVDLVRRAPANDDAA